MSKKSVKYFLIPLILIMVIFAGFFWYLNNLNTAIDLADGDDKEVASNATEQGKEITIEDFSFYGPVIVSKEKNNLFIVTYNTFETEWSGATYHVDLSNGEITKIDSPYILKDETKYFGVKSYNIDYEYNPNAVGNSRFSAYELDEDRLNQIANELGIEVGDLQIQPFGGKPSFKALVKFEFNTETKKIKLLPNEPAKIPEYCAPSFCQNEIGNYYVGNTKYPTDDFVEVFDYSDKPVSNEVLGIEFSYSGKELKVKS